MEKLYELVAWDAGRLISHSNYIVCDDLLKRVLLLRTIATVVFVYDGNGNSVELDDIL